VKSIWKEIILTSINDFNKYKKAKRIVKDLEKVIHILTLAHQGLKPFREYTSLQETLLCIEDSKMILDIHLSHHKQILANKGKCE